MVKALSVATLERFPLSLIASATLLILALVARAVQFRNNSKHSWLHMSVAIFWTWPICLWGLESIRLIYRMCFVNAPSTLPTSWHLSQWQVAIFCGMYCLTLSLSSVWASLRVALERPPRAYFNGPIGWSLRFGVFSVLIIMFGVFAYFYRLG